MVPGWAAAWFLDAKQRFRTILGYQDFGIFQAKLKDHVPVADSSKVE